MEKTYFVYHTTIGELLVAEKSGKITDVKLTSRLKPIFDGEFRETPLLTLTIQQLHEYLAGKRFTFDLPLAPQGTTFQLAVWQALLDIPYGETRSYGAIAHAIGNPKAARAVGMANHNNPISFIIPCHRVIGANGALVGYGGGLDLKKKLLALESKNTPH